MSEQKSFILKSDFLMKRIYITFDDGPHEHFTARILDMLAEWRAKATFFL
mgnify:CR=1 FL=1